MGRKLLVPHDGYEMSDKALNYAIEIAKAMDMEIMLLRVVPEVIEGSNLLFLSEKEQKRIRKELARINKQVKAEIYEGLKKQLKICESKGVKAYRLVQTGEPVTQIISIANREDPYMIVIGSRKLKGIGKLRVLGSVARRLSESAKCPVIIVH